MGSEFWSAIAGAVLGGLIALGIQVIALRDARKQRDGDRLRVQQALANSLIFKMIRIHGNLHVIYKHIEESIAASAKEAASMQLWQVVLPIANPPDSVHFTSDEMGMLLSLQDSDLFNLVLPMDVIHNSLVDSVRVYGTLRFGISEKLSADAVQGKRASSHLTDAERRALLPRIMELNSLIEGIRDRAKPDFEECDIALRRLHALLQDKVGLTYKLQRR